MAENKTALEILQEAQEEHENAGHYDDGLSKGAIAGIAVAGFLLLGCIIWYLQKRQSLPFKRKICDVCKEAIDRDCPYKRQGKWWHVWRFGEVFHNGSVHSGSFRRSKRKPEDVKVCWQMNDAKEST